jgi:ABC-2 type transport system permease protein
MRSFSDEKKQGTLELLLTKPLSMWQIVNGKFLGAMLLIVIAIIPTLIYVYVISTLGMPAGNIDLGSTMGSYFGLLFLIASYASIGIFTSTISENQIVAFILSVFLCFFFLQLDFYTSRFDFINMRAKTTAHCVMRVDYSEN